MSNFLLENQKGKYRFKINEEIYLLEPTKEQKEKLIKILEENVKVFDNLEMQGVVPVSSIRYILKELASIGEEIDKMTDEEILNAIDNGNRNIVLLFREVKTMLDELLEDLQYNIEQQIKMTTSLIGLMSLGEAGTELQSKLDNFNEEYDKNLSEKDIEEIKENPEKLENKLNKTK